MSQDAHVADSTNTCVDRQAHGTCTWHETCSRDGETLHLVEFTPPTVTERSKPLAKLSPLIVTTAPSPYSSRHPLLLYDEIRVLLDGRVSCSTAFTVSAAESAIGGGIVIGNSFVEF